MPKDLHLKKKEYGIFIWFASRCVMSFLQLCKKQEKPSPQIRDLDLAGASLLPFQPLVKVQPLPSSSQTQPVLRDSDMSSLFKVNVFLPSAKSPTTSPATLLPSASEGQRGKD